MTASEQITRMLIDASHGDGRAADALMPLIYEELRALAGQAMQGERAGHTLQPTALAHEAYLRLIEQRKSDWQSRAHFLAVAAEMVRRILVDHARRNRRQKRGGDRQRVSSSALDVAAAAETDEQILGLHEGLEKLRGVDERQARVVELRFFGGLTIEETAHVLGVSARTVKGDWTFARAWLQDFLDES